MKELLKNLISFRSTSLNERPMVEYISSLLKERNIPHVIDEYDAAIYGAAGKTANLYVDLGNGDEEADALVFLGWRLFTGQELGRINHSTDIFLHIYLQLTYLLI